jgi:hypothetical protein
MVRKGSPVRVRQRLFSKGLLVAAFRGSRPGLIARLPPSRVTSGYCSVADGLSGLADHLDDGAAPGGFELLEQPPVDVQARARLDAG